MTRPGGYCCRVVALQAKAFCVQSDAEDIMMMMMVMVDYVTGLFIISIPWSWQGRTKYQIHSPGAPSGALYITYNSKRIFGVKVLCKYIAPWSKWTSAPTSQYMKTLCIIQKHTTPRCRLMSGIMNMFYLRRTPEDVTEVCKTHWEVPCRINKMTSIKTMMARIKMECYQDRPSLDALWQCAVQAQARRWKIFHRLHKSTGSPGNSLS